MHPLDPQDIIDEMVEKPKAASEVPEFEDHRKDGRSSDQLSKFQVHNGELKRNSSIRCLQDLLKESQSDTPTSEDSCYNDSQSGSDMEVIAPKTLQYWPRILLLRRKLQ